jgi:hypothetical protein
MLHEQTCVQFGVHILTVWLATTVSSQFHLFTIIIIIISSSIIFIMKTQAGIFESNIPIYMFGGFRT